MTLELLEAMTLRDGGTTYVSLRSSTEGEVTFRLDYSLPWDGRPRHIQVIQGEQASLLSIGGAKERSACQQVHSILVAQFGEARVAALSESPETENSLGEGKWRYALKFLRLCIKERKLNA